MKHAIVAFAAVLALAANAQSAHQIVRLDDVILLAQEGLSDKTILAFLENREVGLALGPQEIVTLRNAGVSEEVIRYLIDRTTGGYSAPRSAYVAPPLLPYNSSGYAPYGYGAGYLGVSIFPHWWYDHHHGHVGFGHHAFGDHHLSLGHVGVHGFGHDAHAVPRGGHFSGHGAAVGAFGAHAVGHGGGHDGGGHFAVGQGFGHGFAAGGHGGHAVGRGLGHGAAHGGQGGHSGHGGGHSGGHSGGGHGGHH